MLNNKRKNYSIKITKTILIENDLIKKIRMILKKYNLSKSTKMVYRNLQKMTTQKNWENTCSFFLMKLQQKLLTQ